MRASPARAESRALGPTRPRLRRLFVGSPENIAGTVYGTVVVMGAIAAGSLEGPDPRKIAAIAGATVVVLWLAHVYAHALGEALRVRRRLDGAELEPVARRELSIPLAAVAPCGALLLGGPGPLRDGTAIWLSLGLGLMALAAQGVRYARLERLRAREAGTVIAVNLALGLVIVGLKALIAH